MQTALAEISTWLITFVPVFWVWSRERGSPRPTTPRFPIVASRLHGSSAQNRGHCHDGGSHRSEGILKPFLSTMWRAPFRGMSALPLQYQEAAYSVMPEVLMVAHNRSNLGHADEESCVDIEIIQEISKLD
jgi:hypothetical protein